MQDFNENEISIIIPTWNRSDYLDNLLESLLSQKYGGRFEVIIVDSNSFDNTTVVLNKYISLHENISHIHVQNSLTSKRNAGFRVAKYEWLLFLDDDIEVVDLDFLAKVADLKGVNKTIYSGLIKYPEEWIESSNYYRYRNSRHFNKINAGNEMVPHWSFVAMFFLIKRSDFLHIGGFNEDFKTYGGEDHDFEFRSRELGYNHSFMENAVAIHREGRTGVRNYSNKLVKSSPMFFTFSKTSTIKIKRSVLTIIFISQKSKGSKKMLLFLSFLLEPLIVFLEKTDSCKWVNVNPIFRILVFLSVFKGLIKSHNDNDFYI